MSRLGLYHIDTAVSLVQEYALAKGKKFSSNSLIYSFHWYLDMLDFIMSFKDPALRVAEKVISSKVAEILEKLEYDTVPAYTEEIRAMYFERNFKPKPKPEPNGKDEVKEIEEVKESPPQYCEVIKDKTEQERSDKRKVLDKWLYGRKV